jgi:hypothetical protein
MQPHREANACIDLPAFPVTIRKKTARDPEKHVLDLIGDGHRFSGKFSGKVAHG